MMGTQHRQFSSKWYASRPWLEYSVLKDAAYCFCCRVFKTTNEGNNAEDAFSNNGVRAWKKCIEKMDKHAACKSHVDAMMRWKGYQASTKQGSVVAQLSDAHKDIVKRNREYLGRLVQIILYLAQQGVAFRGHDESSDSLNKGNFLELVDLISKIDPTFQHNMTNMPTNATYLSHHTQNDIIQICAKFIKDDIIRDIQDAGMISIMADETRDSSKTEQLSICVRFVSTDLSEIREEFLAFHDPKELNAKALAEKISNEISLTGISKKLILGQCYDGASVMSGVNNGVQSKLREIYPNALYTHCHAHRLNLVLVDTVSDIPKAYEFFALIEALYVFLSRPNAHTRFVQMQQQQNLLVRELQRLSDTRWASRYQSLDVINHRLSVIIQVLSDHHLPKAELIEARGLCYQILSPDFLCCLAVFTRLLSITHGISEMLQSTQLNVANAANIIDAVKSTFFNMRGDDIEVWNSIWKDVETRLVSLNVDFPLNENRR
jgi:hypothetical protein